jgi:hypothetical protein
MGAVDPKQVFVVGPCTEGMRHLLSFSRPSRTAAMRKERSFPDGVATG